MALPRILQHGTKMRITYTLGPDAKQSPQTAKRCYCFFWSLAVSTGGSSAFFQLLSGSYAFIVFAEDSVCGPRSFSYTTPSCAMIKVITPELRYSAG